MRSFTGVFIIAFGFFFGSKLLVEGMTRYFALPSHFAIELLAQSLACFVVLVGGAGILKGRGWGKHCALVGVLSWMYFHLRMLGWEMNDPEFLGMMHRESDFARYSPMIEILAIAIIHGGINLALLGVQYKNDLTRKGTRTPSSPVL